jgi:hypothetical protein
MKTKILILLVAILIINACNKDKFQTKPVLTFKSVSTTNVAAGGDITFNIEISDKQGDIDSVIYWKKVSFVDTLNNLPKKGAMDSVSIPSDLPRERRFDGDFAITFVNANGAGINISPAVAGKNDSCVFKFWMKDYGNHVSDTMVSPIIIIRHP